MTPGGTTARVKPRRTRLGEPSVRAGDRSDLARQAHLAERDGALRQRPVGDGAGQREGDGQVGCRLGEAHPADRGQVGVAGADGRLGPFVEDREDHVDPRRVEAARRPPGRRERRPGDEGLHLGDEGATALERHGDAGARNLGRAPGEEQAARIGEPDDPDVGQVEAADLVGGAVAVLHRSHEPQAGVPVALELDHDVDEVLEHARAGDRAVLGDVADEEHRDATGLRGLDQRGGDLAHLGDVAGGALDLGAADGLHGVDDDEVGVERLDLAEHRREVGLAREVEGAGHRLDALGTGAHLCGGLLTADVEDAPLAVLARAGGPGGDVEQERGLADAGLAGDEDDGSRDDAAPEHPVELGHPRGAGRGPADVDVTDGHGRPVDGARRRRAQGDRADLRDAAPRLALAAAADPLGGLPPALRAPERSRAAGGGGGHAAYRMRPRRHGRGRGCARLAMSAEVVARATCEVSGHRGQLRSQDIEDSQGVVTG